MEIMNRINELLNSVLTFIGGIFLVAMIVLTCGNIFFRIVWVPVPGTYELMGLFGAIVTAFALGQTQAKRGHVAVDVLINTFSAKTKKSVAGGRRSDLHGFFFCCHMAAGGKGCYFVENRRAHRNFKDNILSVYICRRIRMRGSNACLFQ